MSIRIIPTTSLEILCKVALNSQVMVKSIEDPDGNIPEKLPGTSN